MVESFSMNFACGFVWREDKYVLLDIMARRSLFAWRKADEFSQRVNGGNRCKIQTRIRWLLAPVGVWPESEMRSTRCGQSLLRTRRWRRTKQRLAWFGGPA